MTNRRPTLCVVAGPNGSGKTTTTIQLLTNEWAADSLYINPDIMPRRGEGRPGDVEPAGAKGLFARPHSACRGTTS